MRRREMLVALGSLPVAVAADCGGYRRVKTDVTLASDIKTISVPTFRNTSLRYRVEQRFTDAVTKEILRRDRRLHITSNEQDADALLTGEIKDFRSSGA